MLKKKKKKTLRFQIYFGPVSSSVCEFSNIEEVGVKIFLNLTIDLNVGWKKKKFIIFAHNSLLHVLETNFDRMK